MRCYRCLTRKSVTGRLGNKDLCTRCHNLLLKQVERVRDRLLVTDADDLRCGNRPASAELEDCASEPELPFGTSVDSPAGTPGDDDHTPFD